MVLAIEPMVNAGDHQVRMGSDGWAVYSQDGSLAAHFESRSRSPRRARGSSPPGTAEERTPPGRKLQPGGADCYFPRWRNAVSWALRCSLYKEGRSTDEGPSFGQAHVREVQGRPTYGAVLVICPNPRHKQRQG